MKNDDKLREFKDLVYKPIYERNTKKVKYELTQKQSKNLLNYAENFLSKRCSPVTIYTNIVHMKNFCSIVKKDFEKITKEDIKKFLAKKSNLKPYSFNIYQQRTKDFFKWFYGVEEKGQFPEIVKWIKINTYSPKELSSEELISWEDINNILLPVCESFRDKALLVLLRETGGRINEILKTNISDVRLENDRAFIKLLNSKRRNEESKRENVLINSFPYIENWLRHHPLKNQKDAPLFINRYNRRITYANTQKFLKKLKRITNFSKKLNPHHFRHSQASDMAQILTDAELRVFGGWARGSPVTARYTHIRSENVNQKILKTIGKIKETPKDNIIKENLQPCGRCNEMVDINRFRFCGKCGMSLSGKEEIKEYIKEEQGLEKLKEKIKKEYENEFENLKEKIKKELLVEFSKTKTKGNRY